MKKCLLSLLLLSAFQVHPQASVCGQFHRKYCVSGDKAERGWLYNAQSKSGLFAQGATSKIRCVVYKGMDYRISVCCEAQLGDKLTFKVFDSRTNDLLYDNATADNAPSFEFQSTATRQLLIEVSVPEGAAEKDSHKPTDAACVGLLIEQRLTEKQGF